MKKVIIIGVASVGFEGRAFLLEAIANGELVIPAEKPVKKEDMILNTMDRFEVMDDFDFKKIGNEVGKANKKGKSIKNWNKNKFWQG